MTSDGGLPVVTCPVCGSQGQCRDGGQPDGYAPILLKPLGWRWSCGEVGMVCSAFCENVAETFGLCVGNRRPNDDYFVSLRGDARANQPHWGAHSGWRLQRVAGDAE